MSDLRRGHQNKSKCVLDLGAREPWITHDTSSHGGEHFCQILSKSIKECLSYGVDTKKKKFDLCTPSVTLTLEPKSWGLHA